MSALEKKNLFLPKKWGDRAPVRAGVFSTPDWQLASEVKKRSGSGRLTIAGLNRARGPFFTEWAKEGLDSQGHQLIQRPFVISKVLLLRIYTTYIDIDIYPFVHIIHTWYMVVLLVLRAKEYIHHIYLYIRTYILVPTHTRILGEWMKSLSLPYVQSSAAEYSNELLLLLLLLLPPHIVAGLAVKLV